MPGGLTSPRKAASFPEFRNVFFRVQARACLLSGMHVRRLVACLVVTCAAAHAAAQAEVRMREPQLDALLRSAMTGPAVDARRSEVSAARHEVDAARWQYAPTLSTQVQNGTGASTQYSSAVRLDQKLYTFGRRDADLGNAKSRRDSAVMAVQETGLGIALQVVGAWQALQSADGQLQAIAAYRERLQALNETIGRRIESGVSPASEQQLMNARLAQSANDQAATRASAQAARATLRQLTGAGVPPLPPIALIEEAPAAPALCQDGTEGDTRVTAAAQDHPAVRRTALDIEAARLAMDSQRAALKPNVLLRVEQPMGHLPDGASKAARVSVLLEYTTDAGLAALSRANAGDDRVASLVAQSVALQREVEQQIRSECAQSQAVMQRASGLVGARRYTQEVLGSYTRLFLAGKRGWLDVLNAAREDFDNEQAALGASAAARASLYRLDLLSGALPLGLPQPDEEPVSRFQPPSLSSTEGSSS